MNMELLIQAISTATYDLLASWSTLENDKHGHTKGQKKLENQVWDLHLHVNKLDISMAKPLLMELYPSKPSNDYEVLLGICLQLVSEIIFALIQQKGWRNFVPVRICGMNAKLVSTKTWETKLHDLENKMIQMTLCQAMMTIWHLANNNFAMFHSIDQSYF